MIPDSVEIAQRYVIELWEERSLAVVSALVDEHYVRRDPLSLIEGRDALRERLRDPAFADVLIVIEDVMAAGDRVVVRQTWQGMHRGEFFGVGATGNRVMLELVQVLTIADGKVAEDATYFDVYALFEQLGALPPPDKLATRKRPTPVLRLVP
jgi:steroid delta-isomerase-like uncharacterized protein